MPLPRALVDRFVRHLGEVLDEVTALAALMEAGGDGRESLRASAHKVAGTAAAYGFPALGERAREVEQAVLAGGSGTPGLAGKVEAFRAALAQASQAGPS